MIQVGIVQCHNYLSVKEKITELFSYHGGLSSIITRGDRVLLKPNLLAPPKDIYEPVTTDGRLIVAMAELLNDFGAKVAVGDSPAFGTAHAVLNKLGVADKLNKIGVEIVEFSNPTDKRKSYTLDKSYLNYDKLINLPKLKVHCQLLLTLSVKNLFGCVPGKRKPLLHLIHGDKENHFAEMLLRTYETIKPAFTIVDGIGAMNEKGPRGGSIKNLGILFSGIDCVAIDRVIVESFGIPFERYSILKSAKELNIGEWRLDQIEFLGEKELPHISLEHPLSIPISFSPIKILISTIKNMMIKRKQRK